MKMKPDTDFQVYLKNIGENLKKLRNSKGLTQEMVAEMNNIDYKYYQRMEAGAVNITVKTLYKISKSLDIDPKKLLDIVVNK